MTNLSVVNSKELNLSANDFVLDFEVSNNSMDASGDLDTLTTIRTALTKVTCKASCTCNCTGTCTIFCG